VRRKLGHRGFLNVTAVVYLVHVPIMSLEVEFQLRQMFGLEFIHLEFDGNEKLQVSMIGQQIEAEVLITQ